MPYTCGELQMLRAANQAARAQSLNLIAQINTDMSQLQLQLVGNDVLGHPSVPFSLSAVQSRIASLAAEIAALPMTDPVRMQKQGWMNQYFLWTQKYDAREDEQQHYYELEAEWIELQNQWDEQNCG